MSLATPTDPAVETLLSQLKNQTERLLLLLSDKERYVIERRFTLDNKKKATLEEIGQYFHVTRERIRQIEKNALQKLRRNIEKFEIFTINDIAFKHLQQQGGIMREDLLLSKIIREKNDIYASSLILILSLDKRFVHLSNTIYYHPYFRFAELEEQMVDKVTQYSLTFLRKKGDLVGLNDLTKEIQSHVIEAKNLPSAAFYALFQIHKSFKVLNDGIGLIEWRHIHPRTLRDKIYFVLRQGNAPRHFVDISNAISSADFDKKNINLQAIHNELIRHSDFVLIGRGIYALSEWGYKPGTVSTVIESLLRDKGNMPEEAIIHGVLERRQVKPITVILNLKNKPQFTRVGRKLYALRDNNISTPPGV